MKNRFKKPNHLIAVITFAFLILGLLSMCVGQAVAIMKDRGILPADPNPYVSTSVDWASIYPVREENQTDTSAVADKTEQTEAVPSETRRRTVLDRFYNLIVKLGRTEADLEQHFLLRTKLIELSGYSNRLLGKTDFGEANSVVRLSNGHLSSTYQWDGHNKPEIDQQAEEIASFADWLDQRGTKFFYVQIPTKIDPYDENPVNKTVNLNNDYYDYYLSQIQAAGLDTMDLRDTLHDAPKDHYDYFFKTDGHWTLEAGRLAAGAIADHLNGILNSKALDTAVLNPELYSEKTYERWFLGALGRKVTLGYATPDDFTVYYPNFETRFHVNAPDKDLDLTGSFDEVMFNNDLLNTKDYYGTSIYEAVGQGNRPLIQFTNQNSSNDLKVLFIRDSFSLAVIPYFSLMVHQSDWIDVRPTNGNFTGSLKTYIEDTKPDVVILMYDMMNYKIQ